MPSRATISHMRSYILILFFFNQILASDEMTEYEKNIIQNPALSERCLSLLKQRKQKIESKQKIQSLLIRNQKLTDYVAESKPTIKGQVNTTQQKLELELQDVIKKIKKQEEVIIKKGCPGISTLSI